MYYSSNVVNVMHGRRFSVAHDPVRKFSVPSKERRFSGQYTPQIQEDIITKLETQKAESTTKLVLMRGLVVLVLIGILAVGILIRLTVHIPPPPAADNSTTDMYMSQFQTVATTLLY